MKWTMVRAWLLGVAVLVLAHLLWWGVAADISQAGALRVTLFAFPVLAAFLVTYLAPDRKVALGLSMCVVGAVLGMLAMLVYGSAGYHVDNIGGPIATFGVLLAMHFGYALAGTLIGYVFWRVISRRLTA